MPHDTPPQDGDNFLRRLPWKRRKEASRRETREPGPGVLLPEHRPPKGNRSVPAPPAQGERTRVKGGISLKPQPSPLVPPSPRAFAAPLPPLTPQADEGYEHTPTGLPRIRNPQETESCERKMTGYQTKDPWFFSAFAHAHRTLVHPHEPT